MIIGGVGKRGVLRRGVFNVVVVCGVGSSGVFRMPFVYVGLGRSGFLCVIGERVRRSGVLFWLI